MDKSQLNGYSSVYNGTDDDFEFMGDIPREDSAVIERRRQRNNEITKKLGAYLLKGYCMLSDACVDCDCILLRTPDRQLLCVGCAEVDVENAKEIKNETNREENVTSANKKKDRTKHPKKSKKKSSSSTCEDENHLNEHMNYSTHLESKLKWAVDELAKSQNPNRINAMCTVITNLTESIKALKEYESNSV